MSTGHTLYEPKPVTSTMSPSRISVAVMKSLLSSFVSLPIAESLCLAQGFQIVQGTSLAIVESVTFSVPLTVVRAGLFIVQVC